MQEVCGLCPLFAWACIAGRWRSPDVASAVRWSEALGRSHWMGWAHPMRSAPWAVRAPGSVERGSQNARTPERTHLPMSGRTT